MTQALDSATLASFGVYNNQIVCDTGETLTVLAIARFLPNQRLVCKCLLNKVVVYAKIFIGLRANIHATREALGTNLLTSANILTPKLLFETTTYNQPVIVYAAIENAVNAEDFMRNVDFLGRREMVEKLAQTVAHHHNANLIQTDIHLKNFLIADVKSEAANVYTIDGDGVQTANSKSQKQRNLATLFSKMDVLEDDGIYGAYEAYCSQRGIENLPLDEAAVWVLTQKIRRQTASEYADKKVFRQCGDVNITRHKNLFIASASSVMQNALPQTIEQAEAHITPNFLLKDGNTCTVALAEIGDKKVVFKRYNIKSFWHGASRAFRQTRAANSWANAHRLYMLGVATAAPIALIEERKFGVLNLKARAYFLAEYIDAPDVTEFFAKMRDKTKRAEAVKNIVTLFYKLYLLQISHGDMKANNIKMQGTQPVLIDLDSMHQHTSYFRSSNAHVRDLRRFMQNWQNDNALYNAFVKTFNVVYDEDAPLYKAGITTNKELAK